MSSPNQHREACEEEGVDPLNYLITWYDQKLNQFKQAKIERENQNKKYRIPREKIKQIDKRRLKLMTRGWATTRERGRQGHTNTSPARWRGRELKDQVSRIRERHQSSLKAGGKSRARPWTEGLARGWERHRTTSTAGEPHIDAKTNAPVRARDS